MQFNAMSIITLLGGLAMFLYGIEVMGDGLKNSSADALRRILSKVTSSPITGFLLGCVITAIVQSSMATVVLVTGLISAGILNAKQSISIVFGANVGTTITGQLIRLLDIDTGEGFSVLSIFDPSTLAPIALIIGILFIMFIKKGNSKNVGSIAIGLGILFIGLMTMSESMKPFAQSEAFRETIKNFSRTPIWGLLIGTVLTAIVQSSSASVGILQSLCATGVMQFSGAYSYVIGAALGTGLITAFICSIGSSKTEARRIGVIHILFNVVGALLCMAVVEVLNATGVISEMYAGTISSGGVADFQTIFKLATALILLPMIPLMEKISRILVKDAPGNLEHSEIETRLNALDANLLMNAPVALQQTENMIGYMATVSTRNYNSAIEMLFDYKKVDPIKIDESEELLDRIADATNQYLIKISPHIEKDSDNDRLNFLIKALTSFERIGDLAINIVDNLHRMHRENAQFSAEANQELHIVTDAVRDVLKLSEEAFLKNDPEIAKRVEPLEEVIDDLVSLLKERHIERQKVGECTMINGILYQNILQNLERISDQCSDLAVYLLAMTDASIKGNEHQYLRSLHASENEFYTKAFKENYDKYISALVGSDQL